LWISSVYRGLCVLLRQIESVSIGVHPWLKNLRAFAFHSSASPRWIFSPQSRDEKDFCKEFASSFKRVAGRIGTRRCARHVLSRQLQG